MSKKDYDVNAPLWSIMTKTRGGTVSVNRDLTLDQVKRIYERLDPWYGQHSVNMSVHKDFLKDGVLASSSGGGSRSCQNSDVDVREVFGPSGWDGIASEKIKGWPTYSTVWTDDKWNILDDDMQDDVQQAKFHRQMRDLRSRDHMNENLTVSTDVDGCHKKHKAILQDAEINFFPGLFLGGAVAVLALALLSITLAS